MLLYIFWCVPAVLQSTCSSKSTHTFPSGMPRRWFLGPPRAPASDKQQQERTRLNYMFSGSSFIVLAEIRSNKDTDKKPALLSRGLVLQMLLCCCRRSDWRQLLLVQLFCPPSTTSNELDTLRYHTHLLRPGLESTSRSLGLSLNHNQA
jgi:hypothetical protein